MLLVALWDEFSPTLSSAEQRRLLARVAAGQLTPAEWRQLFARLSSHLDLARGESVTLTVTETGVELRRSGCKKSSKTQRTPAEQRLGRARAVFRKYRRARRLPCASNLRFMQEEVGVDLNALHEAKLEGEAFQAACAEIEEVINRLDDPAEPTQRPGLEAEASV